MKSGRNPDIRRKRKRKCLSSFAVHSYRSGFCFSERVYTRNIQKGLHFYLTYGILSAVNVIYIFEA